MSILCRNARRPCLNSRTSAPPPQPVPFRCLLLECKRWSEAVLLLGEGGQLMGHSRCRCTMTTVVNMALPSPSPVLPGFSALPSMLSGPVSPPIGRHSYPVVTPSHTALLKPTDTSADRPGPPTKWRPTPTIRCLDGWRTGCDSSRTGCPSFRAVTARAVPRRALMLRRIRKTQPFGLHHLMRDVSC